MSEVIHPEIAAEWVRYKYVPGNRATRRELDKEFKSLTPLVELCAEVETNFMNSLFDSNLDQYQYDEIYQYYLERWHECFRVHEARLKKAVYLELNPYYFVETYGPKQMDKVHAGSIAEKILYVKKLKGAA